MNSVQGDLQSVGEFIRLYLTRNNRWLSPLFLAGESYGTTRAAGVSGYLTDKGIVFNGVTLLSEVLDLAFSDWLLERLCFNLEQQKADLDPAFGLYLEGWTRLS